MSSKPYAAAWRLTNPLSGDFMDDVRNDGNLPDAAFWGVL